MGVSGTAYRRDRRSSRPLTKKSSSGSGGETDDLKENKKEDNVKENLDLHEGGGDDEVKEERVFHAVGYEAHLVESLEKDILQRDPNIKWTQVAGLTEAKAVLQEAMVLPLLLPDYFKVRRLNLSFYYYY